MIRHGEVLLEPVFKKDLPKKLELKNNILANGSTGHNHVLDENAKVYTDGTNQYVITKTPSQLTHPEHGAVTVQPGVYAVKIQHERDLLNDEIRAVRD